MRRLSVDQVRCAVAELCREANVILPRDVKEALEAAEKRETSASGHFALQQILANADYAERSGLALCQDGGITTVFLDIGQEVVWEGGFLEDAVNDGVREGYQSSYLRGSVLDRPFNGRNTGDNTPAVIHTRIVPGDAVTVTVLPKGGGADNASQLRILTPAQGLSGVHEFVLDTVKAAGPGACPPLIVGVGIGGSFDSVGLLARRALLRDIGTRHPDPDVAEWEKAWLRDINSLGIGPQGYGGLVTALAVHIVTAPRHIASIPVAVNLQCHSARKGVRVL